MLYVFKLSVGLLLAASFFSGPEAAASGFVRPIHPSMTVGSAGLRQITVTGQVNDPAGEPLVGVTVAVPGTNVGTSTDLDGKYSLSVAADAALSFSFLGYASQTIEVGGRTVIDVVLREDAVALEQLVVVGYGTQKKINLTGAVSQIGSEVIEDRPAPNVSRLLQGTLPNLNIRMVDGSPTRTPDFNIRGATSIGAGGSALVLIDGVEGDPNLVNPSDIESVSILRDASSAAVYGSRAAFGVVLITTKSARQGQSNINFRISQSFNQRTVVPNLVTDGYEWARNFDEAFFAWYDYKTHPMSVNSIFPFSLDYLERLRINSQDPNAPDVVYNEDLGRYEYFGNTDWFDLLHREMTPATEASVSASGGSDKASYYISGLYYFQDGIFEYSPDKFRKFNVRAKGDVNLNSWLTLSNNMDISTFSYDYPLLANGDGNVWRYLNVQGFPMAVMNNPDGTFTHIGAYTGGPFADGSSFSEQNRFFIRTTPSLTATPFGELLTFKADFTYSRDFDKDKRVNNYINYSNSPGSLDRFGQSLLRQYSDETSYWGSNITVELKPETGEDHEFSLLAGYNAEHSELQRMNASRDGLLVPSKPDYNLVDGLNYSLAGGGLEWAYQGVFYRANYSYKNKYLLELNGRYDGSSKFPEEQRFGFFPSVSAGWNLAEEAFMDGTNNWLDQLKIRSSYGSLGNGNVAPYRYMEVMSVAKSGVILEGVQKGYTYLPGVVPAGLTWEKATTFNIGLDAALLKSRLNINFDWYNRQTTDMFTYGQPLPNVFGATVPYGNYADLQTMGWELTLGWRDDFNLGNSPFNYSFTGSLWDNRSEITKFNNPTKRLSSNYYVGHEIGEIWGYETLGFFTSEEEIANHADQSFLQNSNNRQYLPGDLKFADLNQDGFINQGENTVDNPGDRKIIGNSSPRYQFGFTLAADWKGFGISAFFQGIGKRDWYFAPEADLFWGPYNRPYGFQPVKLMENIWSEENPDAYFPRFRGYTALGVNRSLGAPQTRYLQDASYLRLKSLTIDYNIPSKLLEKAGMRQATVYVTGQNIFTLSGLFKYTDNFDPEIIENPVGDMLNGYGQGDAYPMLKTFTLGLNLTF
ncbi:TonB-linked SusC/RagA family outer membrane protein [Anseongella ginsenosidimutans]|uniref:TonB-linked SusC/RagA family outer membrane protein n=2 Tax=Anseongella ginsenosidimutans TaxID=496056 RepID=A0A4R3KLQ3_9SPHI|nr:TonB-dependent receptor [Anseongella ginsenosidimutans]TCS85073.1 TonB-linked SusC/RagA family outer membrane protein [Anseongella ginsenosidimutans]